MLCNQAGMRGAIIVAHPAHLLTVAGVLVRWQPDILILNRTSVGPGAGQHFLIEQALDFLGIENRVTSLDIDEQVSYQKAINGDFSFFAQTVKRILGWLETVRPDIVLGDALEMYNYHHDLGCVQSHAALGLYAQQKGQSVPHYEFPLSCQEDAANACVSYGVFVGEQGEALRLSDQELSQKLELIDWAADKDPFIAEVAPLFGFERGVEKFRMVNEHRNFTVPRPGLAFYYDQRGREEVARQRYQHVISFAEHFVPAVHQIQAMLKRVRAA